MARFLRSQTLTLLEKLNELDADEQADICESLHDHADELTAAASHASGMTVKASRYAAPGDGHSLSVSGLSTPRLLALTRMPGADKPVRARQQVIAGIGEQALNQSRSDSEVYTELTMGIRGGVWKVHRAWCEMPHRCVRRKFRLRLSSASSLTDSLRSVVRLRLAVSTYTKTVA